MLFGRKNPPTGSPKAEGAGSSGPAVPDATAPDAAHPGSATGLSAAIAATPPETAVPPAPAASAAAAMPIPASTYRSPYADKGPEMTTSTPKPPSAPTTMSGPGFRTDAPRRVVDIPGAPQRKPEPQPAAAPSAGIDQQRRLTVGRDISLSGEISSCDVLVVEGTVEAKLRDGRNIEIAEAGLFKGSVEIDEADIAGRFEGDILVRGRLRVRSTGRIHGSIKYGELEVEAGGRLIGDIQSVDTASPSGAMAQPAPVQSQPIPMPMPTPMPAPAPVPGAAE